MDHDWTRRRWLNSLWQVAPSGVAMTAWFGHSWSHAQTQPPADVATTSKGRVLASFSILADLASAVAPPGVQVTALVGPNADAHAFEPGPHHARVVKEADVIIVNGLGFEGWIERLIRASGFRGSLVVASQGVPVLSLKTDAHHHHHHHHAAGKPKSKASVSDPHAWQNLANGERYSATIAQALSARWPEHRDSIQARHATQAARMRELDAQLRKAVDAIPRAQRRVVTSHDAFAYLGDAYGIDFIAPQGWTTASQPSAASVARLIRLLRERQASAVFLENISDPRLIKRISDEAGATVGGTLYSDALSERGGPADSYMAMVRHNVESMVRAMGASSTSSVKKVGTS